MNRLFILIGQIFLFIRGIMFPEEIGIMYLGIVIGVFFLGLIITIEDKKNV